MDKLEYIQAVESGLDRYITPSSTLEKLVYELYDEDESTEFAIRLCWDQRNDSDVCEPRD